MMIVYFVRSNEMVEANLKRFYDCLCLFMLDFLIDMRIDVAFLHGLEHLVKQVEMFSTRCYLGFN